MQIIEWEPFFKNEFLEFSLNIGCPINCLKYCPQEVTIKRYASSVTEMSMESFKAILNKTPRNIGILFSGLAEPFCNPRFTEMAEIAYSRGHKLVVFTTLLNAKKSDVERLSKLRYELFCIHLPDGKVTSIETTREYQENVFSLIRTIPTVSFQLMNDRFITHNRENVTRGLLPKKRRLSFCMKLKTPQFVVLPNGDVHICWMDFGLKHKIGNLLSESYETVKERHFRNSSYWLCQYCALNTSARWHFLTKTYELVHKTFGKKTIT